jgi:hypothetical protein
LYTKQKKNVMITRIKLIWYAITVKEIVVVIVIVIMLFSGNPFLYVTQYKMDIA